MDKKNEGGLDLADLTKQVQKSEGEWMDVLHPGTGEPFGLRIRLCGQDSKAFQDANKKMLERELRAQNRGAKKDLTVDELFARNVALNAACVVEWEGMKWEGKALECNVENATKILTEARWINDQVSEFIRDRSNFLQK